MRKKKDLFNKMLVLGILILFSVTSLLPSITGIKNDNQDRYNAYIKKNCKLYKTYDNIFNKVPSQYKVICDNHFDYFVNI